MAELKPCPFCGGQAEIRQYQSNGLEVRCPSCKIGFKQKVLRLSLEWLHGKMIETWNKRIAENPKLENA